MEQSIRTAQLGAGNAPLGVAVIAAVGVHVLL